MSLGRKSRQPRCDNVGTIRLREVARALGVNASQVHLAKFRVGRLLKKEIQRLQGVV